MTKAELLELTDAIESISDLSEEEKVALLIHELEQLQLLEELDVKHLLPN